VPDLKYFLLLNDTLFTQTMLNYLKVIFFVLLFHINIANAVSENSVSLYIVLSSTNQLYYDVANSIKVHLEDDNYSYVSLKIIPFDELSQFSLPGDRLADNSLFVTVGVSAAKAVFEEKILQPVISVLVPEYSISRLIKNNTEYASRQLIGVIYLDQPLKRQIKLAYLLKPDMKKIGVPVGIVSSKILTSYIKYAKNTSLKINTITIDSSGVEYKTLKKLIDQSDVILAVPDPLVHKPFNAKKILYGSYRAKKPVIAFSKAYVTAGALASVYSTADQIGKQTAEKIINASKNIFEYPTYFSISINESVAKMLGIPILEKGVLLRRLESVE